MAKRRVVVTGLGALTPVGNNINDAWRNIVAGKSGVTPFTDFDISDYPCKIYAGIKNLDMSEHLSPKDIKKMDLFVQYGMLAAQQAMDDAGIEVTEENSDRFGVAVGSGIGGINNLEKSAGTLGEYGPRKVSPFFIPSAIINMIAGNISIAHNLKGPNFSVVSACSSGTHNIGEAYRAIQYGDADYMLAGGAEKASTGLGFAGFCALKALSTHNDDPTAASRPWDKARDGFVLGDGAGVLVLEELETAKKRGAKIYAEVIGYGASSDAYHMTAPDKNGTGAYLAMQKALRDAHTDCAALDYINAHATSTPMGDMLESLAISKLCGSHSGKVAVSSTKSMTGHLLGAAGAVEAIFTILAIQNNIAPPTINLDDPEDTYKLNYVPNVAQEHNIKVALSNSFGFGGTNATIVFKEF